jgi:hypothetical protein
MSEASCRSAWYRWRLVPSAERGSRHRSCRLHGGPIRPSIRRHIHQARVSESPRRGWLLPSRRWPSLPPLLRQRGAAEMLSLDGSDGEWRSDSQDRLGLLASHRRPVRIEKIRAACRRPDLLPQHPGAVI